MYINRQGTPAKKCGGVFRPAANERTGTVADGDDNVAVRTIDAAGKTSKTCLTLTAYHRSTWLYWTGRRS